MYRYFILITLLASYSFKSYSPNINFTVTQIFPEALISYNEIFGSENIDIIAVKVDFTNKTREKMIMNLIQGEADNPQYELIYNDTINCQINWGRGSSNLFKKDQMIVLDGHQNYIDTLYFSICNVSKFEVNVEFVYSGIITKEGLSSNVKLKTSSTIKINSI